MRGRSFRIEEVILYIKEQYKNFIIGFLTGMLLCQWFIGGIFLNPGFLGALFGALITGGIALVIYWSQNRKTDNKEKEIESKNFIREFQKIKYLYANGISYHLKNLYEECSKNQRPYMSQLNKHIKGFEYELSQYGGINEQNIPMELYMSQLNFNRYLMEIDTLIKQNFISKTPIIDEGFKSNLRSLLNHIEKEYEEISSYYKNLKK